MDGIVLDADDLAERRRRMEGMVRLFMEYNEDEHGSLKHFDEVVQQETERRLKVGDIEGSSLISAVMGTFKRDGVHNPGDIRMETNVDDADEIHEAKHNAGTSTSRRISSSLRK